MEPRRTTATCEQSAQPTDEEIALCAYRIWLQEGCPHGRDREHWLKARELILAGQSGEPGPPTN